jgi:hypothetical protein
MPMFFRYSFLIVSVALTLLANGETLPDKIPPEIITAFKTGNYRELGRRFNSSVELVIIENENVYSKAQAEIIMKDFFSRYPPTGFMIRHEESREGLCYAIGRLNTRQGSFRVVILLKSKGEEVTIHQLRIEKDDSTR